MYLFTWAVFVFLYMTQSTYFKSPIGLIQLTADRDFITGINFTEELETPNIQITSITQFSKTALTNYKNILVASVYPFN